MGRDVCLVTGMLACASNQLRATLRFDALGMKWGEDQRSSFTLLETFGLTGPLVQFREASLLPDPAGLRKTFQVFHPTRDQEVFQTS
jgi:hypothetical protein